MKKLTSIQSTKPQEFLYTDFSIQNFPNDPKHALKHILAYLFNTLNYRVYLTKADIDEIFDHNEKFLKQYLPIEDSGELWNLIDTNKDDRLQERQIISFLTKILMSLTKRKNQCAPAQNYDKFAELKADIEWFQIQIVKYEAAIRDKIKDKVKSKFNQQRNERSAEFQREEQEIKRSLSKNVEIFQKSFNQKSQAQRKVFKRALNEKVNKEVYVFKPSKKLHLAKDKSLLAKLAPYKNDKKRPYECKTLQKSLQEDVKDEKARMEHDMNHFKQVQMEHLKHQQKVNHECYLDKLKNHNSIILSKLEIRKDQLQKAENRKIQKLMKENDKMARERIRSLQNSLRAYSQRDETHQIRDILEHHYETVQFQNNIEDVIDPVKHNTSMPYSTLNIQVYRNAKEKKNRYSELRTERKMLRKIRNQAPQEYQTENVIKTSRGRKSLVDLYDQGLQHI